MTTDIRNGVETTQYGFIDGPAEVVRLATMPDGSVVIRIKTKHKAIDVYATPGGRSLRVFADGAGELKAAKVSRVRS